MQVRHRFACLSAAVLAVITDGSIAEARDLVWDASGTSAPTGVDGGGNWNATSTNWIDFSSGTGVQTTFNSLTPDSARFGLNTINAAYVAVPLNVILDESITVQNLTLAGTASGAHYAIVDQGDGNQTLTVKGNIYKTGAGGAPFLQLTNGLNLSAGDHAIVVRDSPGDDRPELSFNSPLSGAGAVTIDTTYGASGFDQYGTVAYLTDNNYAGGTTISSGRLILKTGGGLGGGLATISSAGALSFGGTNITTGTFNGGGDLAIGTALKITRSDYGSTTAFSRYTEAVNAVNDGSSNTITFGAIDVASVDARIAANTNRIVLNGPLTTSTGTGILSMGGDFAGFVRLAQDNTAYAAAGGAFRIRGGVELEASSEANLGGPNSKLYLSGGSIHPTGSLLTSGFMTNFGAHDLSGAPVNTGVNIDAGQTFNVNNINAVSANAVAIGTRGTGTINFNGNNVFTGKPFFDAGTVNINDNITFGGFATRSPVLNIASNVTLIKATQTGNEAIVIAANNPDASSLNIASNLTIDDAGGFAVGNDQGAVGSVTNAGTLKVGNEFWIGNSGGTGTYTQTGGALTVNNWFAVGRDVRPNNDITKGSNATFVLSGGSVTKTGGGNSYLGEKASSTLPDVAGSGTMTLSNNASFTVAVNGGEFWLGQGGGRGELNINDTASFTVNNWLALGRANNRSVGVLNLNGGTLTKAGGGFLAVGSGGTGTFNQTAGTLNVAGTRIAENSSGTMNLSGGTATFTGEFSVGFQADSVGTLNVSGGANVVVPNAILGVNASVVTNGGVINLDGGTLSGASFTAGAAATRLSRLNFNGGTLRPTATNATNFVGAKIESIVRAGGAKIDTNGFDATVFSALTHEAALGATADGGLTKSGAGTLTSTGANTYTGTTTVNAGTLTLGAAAHAPVLNGGGASIRSGRIVFNYNGGTDPTATVASQLKASYATGFTAGQFRSPTATATFGLGYRNDAAAQTTTVAYTRYGDTDLDTDVDTGDVTSALSGFTGAGTGTGPQRAWALGNTDYDDDTDTGDITTTLNNFTGATAAIGAGGSALRAATSNLGAANVADLIYNTDTGGVSIDADGFTVLSFVLNSNAGFKTNFTQDQLNDDTFNINGLQDNTASVIGWVSALATANQGYTGAVNDPAFIGNLLPTGLTLTQLNGLLTRKDFAGPGGTGGAFELFVVGTNVPEPATLSVLGLTAACFGRRRRRNG